MDNKNNNLQTHHRASTETINQQSMNVAKETSEKQPQPPNTKDDKIYSMNNKGTDESGSGSGIMSEINENDNNSDKDDQTGGSSPSTPKRVQESGSRIEALSKDDNMSDSNGPNKIRKSKSKNGGAFRGSTNNNKNNNKNKKTLSSKKQGGTKKSQKDGEEQEEMQDQQVVEESEKESTDQDERTTTTKPKHGRGLKKERSLFLLKPGSFIDIIKKYSQRSSPLFKKYLSIVTEKITELILEACVVFIGLDTKKTDKHNIAYVDLINSLKNNSSISKILRMEELVLPLIGLTHPKFCEPNAQDITDYIIKSKNLTPTYTSTLPPNLISKLPQNINVEFSDTLNFSDLLSSVHKKSVGARTNGSGLSSLSLQSHPSVSRVTPKQTSTKIGRGKKRPQPPPPPPPISINNASGTSRTSNIGGNSANSNTTNTNSNSTNTIGGSGHGIGNNTSFSPSQKKKQQQQRQYNTNSNSNQSKKRKRLSEPENTNFDSFGSDSNMNQRKKRRGRPPKTQI